METETTLLVTIGIGLFLIGGLGGFLLGYVVRSAKSRARRRLASQMPHR